MRHRLLVSPEFCGRSLECGSWIALLCVCLDSSFGRHSRVDYLAASCGDGVLGVFRRLLVLWVSFRSFVVHMVSWRGILWGSFEVVILGVWI